MQEGMRRDATSHKLPPAGQQTLWDPSRLGWQCNKHEECRQMWGPCPEMSLERTRAWFCV